MSRNKKKIVIKIAGGLILSICIAGVSFTVGRNSRVVNENQQINIIEKIRTSTPKETEVEKIAIVNLDNGIAVNNELINYAGKLLGNLKENFVLTGLEDARQGLKSDKYGAYIIIPATFSENVNSLNTTPQKTDMEFGINQNLSREATEKVILDTITFTDGLSNELSYMYINSILKEFHNTQDNVLTVMDNDAEDRDVILKIKPVDLFELVETPELEKIEPNREKLEIEEYISQNKQLIDTVNEQYAQYISMSREDYEILSQEGALLLEEWGMMGTTIEAVNLIQDENGELLYEHGIQQANGLMETYNAGLEEKEEKLTSASEAAITGLNNIYAHYEDCVEKYNKELLEVQVPAAIDAVADLYTMPVIGAGQDKILIGEREIPILYTQESEEDPYTAFEIKWKAQIAILEDYTSWSNAYIAYLEQFIPESENGNVQTYSPDPVSLGDAGYESWMEEDGSGMLADIQNGLLSSTFHVDPVPLNAVDVETLAEDLDTAIRENFKWESIEGLFTEAMETKIRGFDDTVKLMVGTEEIETSVTQLLEEEISRLSEENAGGINLITPFDSAGLQELLQTNVVAPLVENTDSIKQNLLTQYKNEKEQYDSYNKLLLEYDPFTYINQAEIQGTVSQMHENGSIMQDGISEFSAKESEYVEKVYSVTNDNTGLLMENIHEATEKSFEAVSRGLGDAQAVKDENSIINQELLYGITKKLPYTRLGSLEYTQAYEFIANPLEVTKKEERIKTTSETMADGNHISTKKAANRPVLNYIIIAIVGLILISVIILVIRKIKLRTNKADMWDI